MVKFIISRLIQTLAILLVLVTLTFFLLRIIPGGPFDTENALPPEVKAHLDARYHLDRPVMEQYFIYVKSLGLGDLGTSYRYLDQSVLQLITETLPVTLALGSMSLVLSYVLGIILGLIAAFWHNRWQDRMSLFFVTVGVSIPSFLLAPLLIIIFSFWLDLLPPALWTGPSSYVLPVFVLGVRPAAMIARLIRSSALDIMNSDFIRTARSKGVSESTILFKHVFKNSLIPVFGISGPLIANILSGSFIVEIIFAIPGLGHHFVDSVLDRDYPLILSLTILYALFLSISNLVMDLAARMVDPRINMS